jgi:hypothetical protein
MDSTAGANACALGLQHEKQFGLPHVMSPKRPALQSFHLQMKHWSFGSFLPPLPLLLSAA